MLKLLSRDHLVCSKLLSSFINIPNARPPAERQDAPERHRPSVGGFRHSGGLHHLHLPHPVRHQRRARRRLGGHRDILHPVSARPEPFYIHVEHEHQRHSDRLLGLLPRPLRRPRGLSLKERDILHFTLISRSQCVNFPLRSVRPVLRRVPSVLLQPLHHKNFCHFDLRVLLDLHIHHPHRAEHGASFKGGSNKRVWCNDSADYSSH